MSGCGHCFAHYTWQVYHETCWFVRGMSASRLLAGVFSMMIKIDLRSFDGWFNYGDSFCLLHMFHCWFIVSPFSWYVHRWVATHFEVDFTTEGCLFKPSKKFMPHHATSSWSKFYLSLMMIKFLFFMVNSHLLQS